MADTTALKNRIRAAIKANDNQEITGPVLQQALLDIVDELDLNPELESEAQQRQSGDNTLQQNITAERTRAEGAESATSYFICDTAAATAAKTVASDKYVLTVGGSIKIKMTNTNTAVSDVTLKIGSADAKPLYYAGQVVSTSNTWEAGETIEVYYDGTNYQANNVTGDRSGIYDISAEHNNTTYADLVAALGTNGKNIPQSLRKGGMSVKFVQSSNNKYVQYFLTKDEWSVSERDWEKMNLEQEMIKTTDGTNDVDLQISDTKGFILMQLKDGHIQTKNFNSKNTNTNTTKFIDKIELEFGNLTSNGKISKYSSTFLNYARTGKFLKINKINLPYNFSLYVYDSNFFLLDKLNCLANTNYSISDNNWVKIVINYEENNLQKQKIILTGLEIIATEFNSLDAKSPLNFQYAVNYKKGRGLYKDGDLTYSEAYNITTDIISSMGRISLPKNYTRNGKPTKLIWLAHGTHGWPWMDLENWSSTWMQFVNWFNDNGYAVYGCFSSTSYYTEKYNPSLIHEEKYELPNYGTPIQLAAQVDAYKWIINNFNVEHNIFIAGFSHGGIELGYAFNHLLPVKAIGEFCPMVTQIYDKGLRNRPWGYYTGEISASLDDLCFDIPEGLTFEQMVLCIQNKTSGWDTILNNNYKKQVGLIPYIAGIVNESFEVLYSKLINGELKQQGAMDNYIRHSDIPIKIWGTPDDAEVDFSNMWNFIKTLQNGNSYAEFRMMPSNHGSHYCCIINSNTQAGLSLRDNTVSLLGIPYTPQARGLIELINFFEKF